MLLITALAIVAIALAAGAAGDFLMLVTSGAAIGNAAGAVLSLVAERRNGYRPGRSPWADVEPVDARRYLTTGALIGIVLGAVAGVVDALF